MTSLGARLWLQVRVLRTGWTAVTEWTTWILPSPPRPPPSPSSSHTYTLTHRCCLQLTGGPTTCDKARVCRAILKSLPPPPSPSPSPSPSPPPDKPPWNLWSLPRPFHEERYCTDETAAAVTAAAPSTHVDIWAATTVCSQNTLDVSINFPPCSSLVTNDIARHWRTTLL